MLVASQQSDDCRPYGQTISDKRQEKARIRSSGPAGGVRRRLAAPPSLGLVANECGTPGQSCPEGLKQQQIATLNAAVTDRYVQRERY